ncbi:Elongation factor 1-gamma [Taphrina deformans PYCC 5710]|uniref:Elongation factor 1-gamma n=1 Tax=Taphrina deformans (strain PYCC 5710 / ATCC 11124 / CBS 356.35 / IMI 108563 / JCM 9778 / NBRC 8474) TaxID=1097556 RepID=R4XIZ5_TAPDE|nr:Elongation factor 1-gamma [Taphrina deformans PYCC 5710]|eukprot:CCG83345.1 Elongation factor 1-gamma [Taphrina deformans PYCC 5710]
MSFGSLYSYAGNPRTTALLAVAKANALDVDIIDVKPGDAKLVEKFPMGKIPGFVGSDGFVLHETNAIAIYCKFKNQNEKTTLLGKTKADYATILQWLSFANTEVLPTLGQWFGPLIGRVPYNKKTSEDAEKSFNTKVASYLESVLKTKTFLVGHRVTLADLVVAAHLSRGFEFVLGSEWRSQYPNITRYFETVVNQHIYKGVAGDAKLCEEPVKYTPPKKEEKPKADKPKAEKAPKKAAKKEDDDEEDEPLVPVEKKAAHPLAALPNGSLVMDEWKRQYSNEETREVALPWFFKNFDAEHYSVYRVDYKYNDELTLTFMSSNLITGFFSRLEASRKFLFGCALVAGESNNSVITGAFLVKGQEAEPAFDVAPDWESYKFTKLDVAKDDDKALIEDLWTWDKPVVVDGKTYEFADGKVFK